MASHWGLSWGTNWAHSWDYSTVVAVVAGGKTPWHKDYKGRKYEEFNQRPAQTKPYVQPDIAHSASILSTAGGHARAASLTAKQRTNIATIAAKARWK